MMKNKSLLYKIVIFFVCIFSIGGITYYYYYHSSVFSHKQENNIYDFDEHRDSQDIHTIMKKNWYWLISSDDFSVDFMLKNRAPNNREPHYFGKLIIKVLRIHDKFAGFVAYYKKNVYEGFILFLVVGAEFRGRGYGVHLINYAVNALTDMGVSRIRLVTRITNLPAQSVYRRAGFEELYRTEDGFIYFEKKV